MNFFNIKMTVLLKGLFFSTVLLVTSSCSQEEIANAPEEQVTESPESTDITAKTVDTSTLNVHDFDNGGLGPFNEDQGFSGSALSGEGMSFTADVKDGKRLKLTWKESEYDGTRRERGHEIKLDLTNNKAIYSGFHLYIPSGQSNNLLNKNTIIWQLYNWNSDGCSNWTAHLVLKNNDLYLDYRSACVSATEIKILDNIQTNKQLAFQIRTVLSGNNHGAIVVKMDGKTLISKKSINLGFGQFDSNGGAITSVAGIKMGLYCYDTSNYTNNEKRILYLDNVATSLRTGSVNNSFNLVDPNRND